MELMKLPPDHNPGNCRAALAGLVRADSGSPWSQRRASRTVMPSTPGSVRWPSWTDSG